MTESEEMYLLTIAQMIEEGTATPIPVASLADHLEIAPVSANQMVHKLAEAGWLRYIPYKGVELTAEGQLTAQRVLHHRRIWEVFLVQHLNLSIEEADAMACRLEHLTPDEVAFKLANYLGNPTISPQGYQIPALPGAAYQGERGIPLEQAPLGESVIIAQIPSGSAGNFIIPRAISSKMRGLWRVSLWSCRAKRATGHS
jgi:DtxR family Mn-dependent transcriptional regulator